MASYHCNESGKSLFGSLLVITINLEKLRGNLLIKSTPYISIDHVDNAGKDAEEGADVVNDQSIRSIEEFFKGLSECCFHFRIVIYSCLNR